MSNEKPPRFARPAKAARHLEISRATLWRWERELTGFPRSKKIGQRACVFDLNEIDAWVAMQGANK